MKIILLGGKYSCIVLIGIVYFFSFFVVVFSFSVFFFFFVQKLTLISSNTIEYCNINSMYFFNWTYVSSSSKSCSEKLDVLADMRWQGLSTGLIYVTLGCYLSAEKLKLFHNALIFYAKLLNFKMATSIKATELKQAVRGKFYFPFYLALLSADIS